MHLRTARTQSCVIKQINFQGNTEKVKSVIAIFNDLNVKQLLRYFFVDRLNK
uniref:Uncharacterized protein n=1 Tax=Rhizophagus irregularis (strain DAOM 181602 / DAOM 197198 / MUCL 43194) TaxID=747089 RepID=U9TE92_RHIID